MMIAIKASTEAMTPKMIVPVESEFDSVKGEAMVVFKAGRDWRVEVVLSAGMFAVVGSLVDENVELLSGTAETRAKKVQYLFARNEAAWQSPLRRACFVYAQFTRNLVVAFHILRRMILIDPTNHQRVARLGQILVVDANEPPGMIWMWSSCQVFQAQSTAASRAAACTFVMASWGGALGLVHRARGTPLLAEPTTRRPINFYSYS
jgi:hypothetical protein